MSKPAKILFYYFVLPHYRFSLFKRLKDDFGWDISIMFPPRGGIHEPKKKVQITGIDLEEKFSQHFTLLPVKRYDIGFGDSSLISFRYLTGILRVILQRKYDVVVLQSDPRDISGFLALIACRLVGVRSIWWNKGFAAESRTTSFFRVGLFKIFSALVHRIISYGDQSSQFFLDQGVSPKKIQTAYNTVDIQEIADNRSNYQQKGYEFLKQQGINPSLKIIGTVGRLIDKKRVQDLCEAVKILTEKHKDVFCIIAGQGPTAEPLSTWVKEQGLEAQIFFTGAIKDGMDNALLSVCTLGVFCGAHGLAINQAMALEVPVVVADEPGSDSEMVVNGVTGIRYEKENSVALAQILDEALNKNIDLKCIVQEAKNTILNRWSERAYASAFDHSLQQVNPNIN